MSTLKASIIVISDTASRDPSTDKCIPALLDVFHQHSSPNGWTVDYAIVPDDIVKIQTAIKGRCDYAQHRNLIVTSGGTGFAQKDITPEVSSYCSPVPRVHSTLER